MAQGHRADRARCEFTEGEKEQRLLLTPGREAEVQALASQPSFFLHWSMYNQPALLEEAWIGPSPLGP